MPENAQEKTYIGDTIELSIEKVENVIDITVANFENSWLNAKADVTRDAKRTNAMIALLTIETLMLTAHNAQPVFNKLNQAKNRVSRFNGTIATSSTMSA